MLYNKVCISIPYYMLSMWILNLHTKGDSLSIEKNLSHLNFLNLICSVDAFFKFSMLSVVSYTYKNKWCLIQSISRFPLGMMEDSLSLIFLESQVTTCSNIECRYIIKHILLISLVTLV